WMKCPAALSAPAHDLSTPRRHGFLERRNSSPGRSDASPLGVRPYRSARAATNGASASHASKHRCHVAVAGSRPTCHAHERSALVDGHLVARLVAAPLVGTGDPAPPRV